MKTFQDDTDAQINICEKHIQKLKRELLQQEEIAKQKEEITREATEALERQSKKIENEYEEQRKRNAELKQKSVSKILFYSNIFPC